MRAKLRHWMDRALYPDYHDQWDNLLFRRCILRYLRLHDVLLDLGAGSGRVDAMDLRGHAEKICGVDPEDSVLDNPFLDESKIGYGEAIPYPDGCFDVVVCNNVTEHLDSPVTVFREVARVLKGGGLFFLKTPNKWHYVPLVACATPQCFHIFINRKRGRPAADTFPTFYRANTPKTIRRYGKAAGLSVEKMELIEGRPEYLRTWCLTYPLGLLYERVVNAFGCLSFLRGVIVAVLSKEGGVFLES